jgi:hypothetical protein
MLEETLENIWHSTCHSWKLKSCIKLQLQKPKAIILFFWKTVYFIMNKKCLKINLCRI